jgi:lysophospholipase L1-like esterase
MTIRAWLAPLLLLALASACSEAAGPRETAAGGAPMTSAGTGAGESSSGSAGKSATAGTGGALPGGGESGAAGSASHSGSGGGAGESSAAGAASAGSTGQPYWVGTWATGNQITEPDNLPPAPGLANATLRQIVRASIGGRKLRVKISNEYGTSPVTLSGVHVAKASTGSAIDTTTDVALTFAGSPSLTIPAQMTATSDPFDFALDPLGKVALTIAFGAQSGDVTGHPGSRTTSYLQSGNQLSAPALSGATTDHWYFISGIDVMAEAPAGAVAILGDSITDGRGSTTNANDRWTDRLAERLQADPLKRHIAVLNLGIGGNAVTTGGLGPTALARFESQVLGQSGVRWVVVLAGINDVGTGVSTSALTSALQTLIDQAHAVSLPIYGVPLLPFAGNTMYDSPATQQVRSEVNAWIREPGHFDRALPLDEAVSDGKAPPGLQKAYDSGDFLHLNAAGYERLAGALDLSVF